jgi:hypothetical protein
MRDRTKYGIRSLCAVGLLVIVPACVVQTVSASPSLLYHSVDYEEAEESCIGLDLVLVIDQSGSMSGSAARWPGANDPLGLRYRSPRWVLEWAGDTRLFVCPDVVHRVGVISFGDENRYVIDLPLTRIEPDTFAQWELERDDLKQDIRARDLGYTDYKTGLLQAAAMLDDAEPIDGEPRKQAIILLTDGWPCVARLGCTLEDDTMDRGSYMRDLEAQVERDLPFDSGLLVRERALRDAETESGWPLPAETYNEIIRDYPVPDYAYGNSTYIWVVAMNDVVPYLDTVGGDLEEIATSHGGGLIDLEQNLTEIPKTFLSIVSRITGMRLTALLCGPFPMEPYLEGALIHVFTSGEDIEVRFELDGHILERGEGDTEFFGMEDYVLDGTIEHYRFYRPKPGMWNIWASDCRPVAFQAFLDTIPVVAERVQPTQDESLPQFDEPPFSDPSLPIYLRYQVRERATGEPFAEDPDYPLSITGMITMPDGTVSPLEMRHEANGTYVSVEPLPVGQVGTHEYTLTATAPGIAEPIVSIFDVEDSYVVGPVTPFMLHIQTPGAGEVISLHGDIRERLAVQPIPVRISLVDSDGKPLAASEVLVGDPVDAFEATVTAAGQRESFTLAPDPSDPDSFVGQATNVESEGHHQLVVEMVGDYRRDKYRLIDSTARVSFERADSLWTQPLTYQGLGGLAGVFVASLAGLMIYGRTNPVVGQLVFVSAGMHEMGRISVSRGRRNVKIGGKELQARHAALGLTHVRAKNAESVPGQPRSIEVFLQDQDGIALDDTLSDGGMAVAIGHGLSVRYTYQH